MFLSSLLLCLLFWWEFGFLFACHSLSYFLISLCFPVVFLYPSYHSFALSVCLSVCLPHIHTHKQDVLAYVEFKHNLEIARKYHAEAARRIAMFWRQLLETGLNYDQIWRVRCFDVCVCLFVCVFVCVLRCVFGQQVSIDSFISLYLSFYLLISIY